MRTGVKEALTRADQDKSQAEWHDKPEVLIENCSEHPPQDNTESQEH
jgi:hypothetical protein